MQAIARVNRVFGEKPSGVVVDFLGIADQLRDAVQTYTQADMEGSPVENVQDEAVPLMQRQYEALRDFFHGFDYRGNDFRGDRLGWGGRSLPGRRPCETECRYRKFLNNQICSHERVNIVQSRTFRESLEAMLTRYTNRALITAQVIDELIGLAREIRAP